MHLIEAERPLPQGVRQNIILDIWHVSSHVLESVCFSFTSGKCHVSEGGIIRLETLIELKFINSGFSSLSSYWNWTNGSVSSDSRRHYLSHQYPPPLLMLGTSPYDSYDEFTRLAETRLAQNTLNK